MTHRIVAQLDLGRKLPLAVLGKAAVAATVVIGLMNAPSSRAQSSTSTAKRPQFEVASVKLVNRPVPFHPYGLNINHGAVTIDAVPLGFIVAMAYAIPAVPHSGWAGLARRRAL